MDLVALTSDERGFRSRRVLTSAFLVTLCTAGFGALACSASSDSGFGDDQGPSGTSGSGSFDPNGPNGTGTFTPGTGSSSPGSSLAEACGGDLYQGEASQLDMYIMMDRSGSMVGFCIPFLPCIGANVWAPVGTALGTFVTLAGSAGIGAGIQFFPLPAMAEDPAICDVNLYAAPAVSIAPLPANGAAIQNAIVNNGPDQGGTPTRPAMEGAMAHAQWWAQQNPSHKVIIVLATDGEPNDCSSDVGSVSAIAASGLSGSPRIETYVIGIGNIASLNQIAAAGGTGQALIVDADPNVASQQFLDAMNAIRGRAVPCDYSMPPQGVSTPQLVNIEFSAPGVTTQSVKNVASQAGCGNGGWFYDDPANPNRIITCPETCNVISTTPGATVGVIVGCPTIIE